MNKKDFRFQIDGGRITILIKIPDHQPPHIHAYKNVEEEDVIFILGEQERDNEPGYLRDKELELCQKWIRQNQEMLLKLWEKLEAEGHITKHKTKSEREKDRFGNKRKIRLG